jgi:tRNA (guanine-N7-)-methyltransferase
MPFSGDTSCVILSLFISIRGEKVTQSFIHIESANYIRPEELPAPVEWREIFGNGNPLALEIGCGIGDFIVKTATDQPDRNFVAIDYYNKGCWKTCRRIDRAGLGNVRVLRVEARSFISDMIAPESLSAVYINCPDPWPKKRHRKRRLVNREFMKFLKGFLAPGADFYFATDFDDYGEDVAAMLFAQEGYANMLSPDLYRHELEGYHLSKYMQKFMGMGKRIYFVHYRKE